MSAEMVKTLAAGLVERHAARLGMDSFAASHLVDAIRSIDIPPPEGKGPRRRIQMHAKIEADSWPDLQRHLSALATEIAVDGQLSNSSISGGYATAHIIMTSEDEAVTHDSWAVELDAYVEGLRS